MQLFLLTPVSMHYMVHFCGSKRTQSGAFASKLAGLEWVFSKWAFIKVYNLRGLYFAIETNGSPGINLFATNSNN